MGLKKIPLTFAHIKSGNGPRYSRGLFETDVKKPQTFTL